MESGNPRTDRPESTDAVRADRRTDSPVTLSPCHPVSLSLLRAWFYLVWLSSAAAGAGPADGWWIALSLLAITAIVVARTPPAAAGPWTTGARRAV